MSNWKLITPKAGTNLIANPSFELNTTGWAASGTNTIAVSGSQSKFGAYSLICTYQNNQTLADYAITLTATDYTASCWVYIPSNWDGGVIAIGFVGFSGSSQISFADADTSIVDKWQRISSTQTIVGGDLVGELQIATDVAPTAGRFIYIDGADAIASGTVETHIDGDQPGCVWNGTSHASTSSRDKFAATGGIVNDLSDDLDFIVASQDGTGMPPVNNLSSALALQPGALFDGQTVRERNFTLTGSIVGSTVADFHAKKQALIKALNPNVTTIGTRSQARTFRYTGGAVDKEIYAVYDGGLEPGVPIGYTESDYKLRLKADDPLFYQVGESGAVLDTNDSATVSAIIKKGSDGLWDVMGAPAMTTSNIVYDIVEDDTYIYIGGAFENLDGVANADNIARYNKATSVWSALGTGLNGACRGLAVATDGTLYLTGSFTSAGGVGANYIASWNGTTFSALGTGLNAAGQDIATGKDGIVYVTGSFTTANGVSANAIASWNGTTFSPFGSGLNGQGDVLKVSPDGTLYVGGAFTQADGVVVNYVTYWDGSTFVAMSSGLGATCYAIDIGQDGIVYVGGAFLQTGAALTVNYVAAWNGTSFFPMGGGFNATCYILKTANNGQVYAGGDFVSFATGPVFDRVARWNGSGWTGLGIDFPGSPSVRALLIARTDDVYIGYTTVGTAYYSGQTAVSYTGTYQAYPLLKIKRKAGISAKLVSVANVTTKAELLFNYDLQDGETLTIDAMPGRQTITSSFYGNVYSELLPNSDFGNFYLMPDNTTGTSENIITAFVDEVGLPSITSSMVWRDTYISED